MTVDPRGTPWSSRITAALLHRAPRWVAEAASRGLGRLARLPLPPRVARAAVQGYARHFGVDLHEADPLRVADGFASLDEFFTRPLRDGVRVVDRDAATLVSPSDGVLREVLELTDDAQVRVKGHDYTLAQLLADPEHARAFAGGRLASIYLHPRDYHRVHAPANALVHQLSVVPGRLAPVNDASVARDPGLFARNERMVHLMEAACGPLAVVMVAAFGVGHMSCTYRRVEPHPRQLRRVRLDPPARVDKGAEIGVFHLGSTVLVVVPPGVEVVAVPGRIRLGLPLFREVHA